MKSQKKCFFLFQDNFFSDRSKIKIARVIYHFHFAGKEIKAYKVKLDP